MKTNKFGTLLLSIIACLLASCMQASGDVEQNHISLSGSKRYRERIQSFAINQEAAANGIAIERRKMNEHDPRILVSSTPDFIVGDWYCFCRPSKASLPLAGFFVNGKNGQIEYRESDVELIPNLFGNYPKECPKNPWTRIISLSVVK